MDNEINIFRQMITQMAEVNKPRREERDWKEQRRLLRRGAARLQFGVRAYPYRREFRKTIYK
jgi:hypothetical protein